MSPEEIRTYLAIGGAALSILVSISVLFANRRTAVKAGEAAAVKEALQEERVKKLEAESVKLSAELAGVKTGFGFEFSKLQESMHGIGELLNGLQTKVAILIERDEREEQRNLAAAQQAAQFAAQQPQRPARAPRAPRT